MPRWMPPVLGLLIAALIAAAPLSWGAYRRANYRNFRVVRAGVLYRSGQLSRSAMEQVIDEQGIQTVISLRYADKPGDDPPDAAEEKYCRDRGLYYFRIRPKVWASDIADRPPPAEEGVKRFLAILDDPKFHPVLIHCFAGTHRTGAHCAIFRMEYDHWTNEQAMAELRAVGYRTLDTDADVFEYLQAYRPRWRKADSSEESENR